MSLSNRKLKIAVLPGDGIGQEIVPEAVKAVKAVTGHVPVEMEQGEIGWTAVERTGEALPQATLDLIEASDAILFGAIGGPEYEAWKRTNPRGSPLLRLRQDLKLFANYRPVTLFPELENASTLKPEVIRGLDLLIIRELNGDIYFGEPRGPVSNGVGQRESINTMRYTEAQIRQVAHAGFRAAQRRRGKLCSVDKANVLETMALWRDVVTEVSKEYPNVELTHLFIDAAAMSLVRHPTQFDVIVTGNMFGDILSDEAAMLTGSLGMLPSASIGAGSKGLYEPIHGSAPDIAGKGVANPLAAILSAALMLRFSFEMEEEARRIEDGVREVLAAGLRTGDIMEAGARRVGTREMGDAVAEAIAAAA
ncbi:3-isopropylmalate dehydrogenase [Sabulicella rubraurantiaca]|uniref:3-isopropylmalate dehydrogenase n=1 Tax=Sabulicella rubraurantiaca TaxID=2811429 RepID=UPI002E287725|nr:3-isopropylmalate dehydrogenase [Sabulicella rubraurantiaca]